jgi:hypothetical protein
MLFFKVLASRKKNIFCKRGGHFVLKISRDFQRALEISRKLWKFPESSRNLWNF